MLPNPILTADEMRCADAATIAAGISERELMKCAASELVGIIEFIYTPRRITFICGNGNNGGDGRIAAEILNQHGWHVTVLSPEQVTAKSFVETDLIIDALFGTGLNKQVEGANLQAIECMNAVHVPIVSVDIPSGVNATTGEIMGAAVKATHTVSFAAPKLGHYLLPGKSYVGELHVVDIGISIDTIAATEPNHFLNTPGLWQLPEPSLDTHKYRRGAALVMGGLLTSAGAAKLTANAALKIGAGAVSVICDASTLPIYAASLTSVMTKLARNIQEFHNLLNEPRITALAIGPGAGVNADTITRTRAILATGKPCVLDADALQPELLEVMHENTVITPHAGEFTRVFSLAVYGENREKAVSNAVASPLNPPINGGNKLIQVEMAISKYKGVLVYKGSDTVIAQAGKAIVINGNAPPTLATAGSGDVLAGIICGLLAQGMAPFDAACAGVWLHGEAANKLGAHFTAEDLVHAL